MRHKLLGSRSEILIAAAELFSKKGYRATTMRDIAKRLKVSKPTLYAGIGGKEAILSEIIQFWTALTEKSLQVALQTEGGPKEKLTALIYNWSRNAVSRRAFCMVFLADERELPPVIVAKYKRWSYQAFLRIRSCVTEGQDKGIFRSDLDATVTTFALVSFINAVPDWFSADGKLTIDEISQNYVALLEGGTLTPVRRPRAKAPRPTRAKLSVVGGKA